MCFRKSFIKHIFEVVTLLKGNDCRIYLKLNQNLQQTAIIIVMQYLIVIVLTILLELNSICP